MSGTAIRHLEAHDAAFLAESTKHAYVLIRSAGLADTMSRYLIRRIEETPAITLLPHTEIIALEGRDHLERLTWRNNQTGETEERDIAPVFVMTGAIPNTEWLDRCVSLDTKGFVKTGPDLSPEDLSTAHWPSLVGHTCSKPASQGFLRRVMCEMATSNVLRLQWEKTQSRFLSCIKCSESKADIDNLRPTARPAICAKESDRQQRVQTLRRVSSRKRTLAARRAARVEGRCCPESDARYLA